MSHAQTAPLDQYFGVVDYAVYQAYLDSGKRDQGLFAQFADNAITVLMKTGTTLIDNAPIVEMKNEILSVSKDFFALSEEVKQNFVFPEYNERGYLGYGTKKIKDLKNMFHADSAVFKAMCGVDFEQINDIKNPNVMNNILSIKNHVPKFNDTVIEFSKRSYQMGHAFTEVLAHYFDLPKEYALNMQNGNNVLRMLHYMPFDAKAVEHIAGATRASAHADVSAFTFLLTSDQPGLQIAPKQMIKGTSFISNAKMAEIPAEKWIEVPTEKNQCIMNIGRTIEILTNGILPATPHQVVPVEGQEGQERFSIPFFYHLPWDMKLNSWKKAVELRNNKNYYQRETGERITLGQYVLEDGLREFAEPNGPVPIYQP